MFGMRFRLANSPKKKASVSVANGITFTRPHIKRRELTIDRIDTGRGGHVLRHSLSRIHA